MFNKYLLTAEWLYLMAKELDRSEFHGDQVEKLSGDNTREDKERVMGKFRSGYI